MRRKEMQCGVVCLSRSGCGSVTDCCVNVAVVSVLHARQTFVVLQTEPPSNWQGIFLHGGEGKELSEDYTLLGTGTTLFGFQVVSKLLESSKTITLFEAGNTFCDSRRSARRWKFEMRHAMFTAQHFPCIPTHLNE